MHTLKKEDTLNNAHTEKVKKKNKMKMIADEDEGDKGKKR